MALDMSQSEEPILSDKTVSRMMARRAVQDQGFKDMLSNFARSDNDGRLRPKNFNAISTIISEYRDRIADQMGLEAPHTLVGRGPQKLNTYLKHSRLSKDLVSKIAIKEEEKNGAASERMEYKWGWVGPAMCIARLAFAFLQYKLRFQADPTPFPFERLPPELRLQVYREVLRGTAARRVRWEGDTIPTGAELILVGCNRKKDFSFRFGEGEKGESKGIDVSLLLANRLVNREALPILYQSRTFEFTTNVKVVIPFLSSLPAEARHHLKGISMELHAKGEPDYCCGGENKCYGKGSDNTGAWGKACMYIGQSAKVKELTVTVNVKIPAEFKSLKWVKALVNIKGLKHLTLQADQHHGFISDTHHTRASHKHGWVSSTSDCNSKHLVPLFDYLLEEMLE